MSSNEIFNMYFGIIDDERDPSNTRHPLISIVKLVLLAVLCGMDELDKIIDYGVNKKDFLRENYDIEEIPSKSTLTRVMVMVNPKWLGIATVGILNTLIKDKANQFMIYGKAIKSTDAMKTIEKMMNIVTVYTNTGISLVQKTVESKTNEIPALQELIEMLNIEGIVITADAMHCQKETAEKIVNGKGDYILQLKANQKNFYEDVYAMFDDKYIDESDKDCEYEIFSTIDKGHGRIEKRTCYVLNDVAYFTDYLANWKGLKKIFAVKREVEKDGKVSVETSCYLSSKNASAEDLLSYTRNHWKIESMHHILDVSYNEDACRVYTKNAQENLNIFRKMGVSIHKKYLKNKKQTVKSNMFNCLLNNALLLDVIRNITELC